MVLQIMVIGRYIVWKFLNFTTRIVFINYGGKIVPFLLFPNVSPTSRKFSLHPRTKNLWKPSIMAAATIYHPYPRHQPEFNDLSISLGSPWQTWCMITIFECNAHSLALWKGIQELPDLAPWKSIHIFQIVSTSIDHLPLISVETMSQ
jgi:hypothetical protein